MKNALLSFFFAAALCACASESYQRPPVPSQSVEVTSPDVCRIYILRMPSVKGLIRGLRASENDHEVGRIGRDKYLCWERKPGRSVVVLTYSGTAFASQDRESMIDVEGAPGQTYYYGITIDEAWTKALVRLLSRDEAREVLSELEPAPVE
jgi:hypothetical protein